MTFRYLTGVLVAFFVVILGVWLLAGQPGSFAEEDGPLEIWSACLMFLAALASLRVIPSRYFLRDLFVPFGFFQLGVRELPFEAWIFDARVLTPAFYQTEGLNFTTAAGAIYALVALWSVLALVIWGLPQGWRALRARRSWLRYFFAAGGCALLAQGGEELLKAMTVGPVAELALHAVEEGFEALFALLLFQALYLAWHRD